MSTALTQVRDKIHAVEVALRDREAFRRLRFANPPFGFDVGQGAGIFSIGSRTDQVRVWLRERGRTLSRPLGIV